MTNLDTSQQLALLSAYRMMQRTVGGLDLSRANRAQMLNAVCEYARCKGAGKHYKSSMPYAKEMLGLLTRDVRAFDHQAKDIIGTFHIGVLRAAKAIIAVTDPRQPWEMHKQHIGTVVIPMIVREMYRLSPHAHRVQPYSVIDDTPLWWKPVTADDIEG